MSHTELPEIHPFSITQYWLLITTLPCLRVLLSVHVLLTYSLEHGGLNFVKTGLRPIVEQLASFPGSSARAHESVGTRLLLSKFYLVWSLTSLLPRPLPPSLTQGLGDEASCSKMIYHWGQTWASMHFNVWPCLLTPTSGGSKSHERAIDTDSRATRATKQLLTPTSIPSFPPTVQLACDSLWLADKKTLWNESQGEPHQA